MSSSFEPSQPATSSNVTPVFGSSSIFDCDLPICPIGPPPIPPPGMPPPPREARTLRPISRKIGRKLRKTPPSVCRIDTAWLGSGFGTTANDTLFFCSSLTSSASAPGKTWTAWSRPSPSKATTFAPSSEKATLETPSADTRSSSVEYAHGSAAAAGPAWAATVVASAAASAFACSEFDGPSDAIIRGVVEDDAAPRRIAGRAARWGPWASAKALVVNESMLRVVLWARERVSDRDSASAGLFEARPDRRDASEARTENLPESSCAGTFKPHTKSERPSAGRPGLRF